jgi:hypothetical protein
MATSIVAVLTGNGVGTKWKYVRYVSSLVYWTRGADELMGDDVACRFGVGKAGYFITFGGLSDVAGSLRGVPIVGTVKPGNVDDTTLNADRLTALADHFAPMPRRPLGCAVDSAIVILPCSLSAGSQQDLTRAAANPIPRVVGRWRIPPWAESPRVRVTSPPDGRIPFK